MHLLLIVLVFFAVIIAAFVIVGGWVLTMGARGVKRLIFGRPVKARPAIVLNGSGMLICSRGECHAENPRQAQFCRRCGEPLQARAVRRMMRVA